MTGCCLYCIHGASYWVDANGKKHVPPASSFGCMNIFCLHESRGPGECYPISFSRCSSFKQAGGDQIQRRREFFSQFDVGPPMRRSSLRDVKKRLHED